MGLFREKSLFVAYFLWFFFGWFGLHHIYLRRDRQSFLWWTTLGGFVGIGWFRDLWRIPEYVDDANGEKHYMETLKAKIKSGSVPRFNISRFAGQMLFGCQYGFFVRLAIPAYFSDALHAWLVPIGITAGVYLVGSIGREKGPLSTTYYAAVACYFVLRFLSGPDVSFMYCALAAACTFNYYRSYDMKPKKPYCVRVRNLIAAACIMWCLWGSFFYHNAYITTEDGEKVPLRDSVSHFFKSPAWLDFKQTLYKVYEQGRSRGWRNMYEEFVTAIDPTGESNACKVLGVDSNATEEVLRKAYKKLVVKWHPDRYKGAEEKFMEIQKAYEILSNRKKKSKSRPEKQRTEF